VSLTLCVLLWPNPGKADALVAYEDEVLALMADHGVRVLQRARTGGQESAPLEIQILEFPSAKALDAYLADDRRTALAGDRDDAIAKTETFEIELI
jgi:hypothetical protein